MAMVFGESEIKEKIELCMCPICNGGPHLYRKEVIPGMILDQPCVFNWWFVACEVCGAVGVDYYSFSAERAGEKWNMWSETVTKQIEKNKKQHKSKLYNVEPWAVFPLEG